MSYLRAIVPLVVSAVVVVALPAVTSATTPDRADPATVTTEATQTAGPVPTATPTGTTAPPASDPPTADAGLTVGGGERSVTYYRERGVPVSASGLDVEDSDEPNAILRIDGEALQELYVVDGAFEVVTTFPVTTPGEYLVTVTAGDRVLASTTLDALTDLFAVTATPRWITAEKLRSDGVTLSAREVPPARPVIAYLGDNPPVTRTSVDDGTVSITVTNIDDPTLDQPGVHWGVLETEDGELASAAVRTTVLDVTTTQTAGEVRATGFEPGSDVTVTSSRGPVVVAADANGVATVTLADFAGDVTASNAAGSITRRVDTRVAPPETGLTPAEIAVLTKNAAAVDLLGEAAQSTAAALKEGRPGPIPDALQPVQDQVLYLAALLDGFPQRPSIPVKNPKTESGSQDKKKASSEEPRKSEVVEVEKKGAEKDVVRAIVDLAADAEDAYARATKEQQAQVFASVTAIVRFAKELQEAQKKQERAVMRASTLELVSLGPVGDVLRVPVPAGLTGRHHVASVEPTSGLLLAWQPFDVETAAGTGTGAGTGALPDTGAPVTSVLVALGAGLLVAGTAAVTTTRRRRTS
jgi:hypothetical protein